MKTDVVTYIKNNVFYIKITNTANSVELSKIAKFGEPSIDFGGSFTGPPAFTLPTSQKKLVSGFPSTYSFDGNADTDAEDKAVVWEAEMRSRISSAVTTLVALVDEFTSDKTYTY